ncbi:RHS repeat-associated core domain-containing protein, partial [Achromobacter sp. NFACC18-2]|uniref:RHS repeat-associated core domain-containing protein n=1 Tax=Achromobacter sp. NFACC18-2 TaxID=1564112 RepID=UPI0008D7A968
EEQARVNRAMGCCTTLFGWDGDTLAWEGHDDQTTHYLYEPGSFVPLAQAISRKPILLHQQPAYAGAYDIDRDPLWISSPDPDPVDAMAWYHCDHLGTPQELTDAQGEIAWSAQYHAWGAAKEAISDAARAAGIRNPIRFQGQYLDSETGLHYNRHRYYDPQIGRFITKDPIGFAGGLNVYQYADNPIEWIDPLGLNKKLTEGRVYRMGSSSATNLTPRPERDATTGLSTALEKPTGRYQTLDVRTLNEGGLDVVQDGKNHASIRPTDDSDMSKLREWANTRGTDARSPYTDAVKNRVATDC